MSWIIAVAALIGTWLNVNKDSRCFVIWVGTNGFWAVYDTVNGLYAQGLLFSIYFVMAIIGIVKWRKE